ncbi:hypothetical protein [Cryptosporangium sp. NPDC048952]|uniref:hypothetical protein n=1 Tax=Cryptosporangium sp. NPDC048952 TaxID=3363961 RepID=UPI003714A2A5
MDSDWVNAGGTVLAALIAGAALSFAKRAADASRKAADASRELARREADRDAAREDERRREQAIQVAAWLPDDVDSADGVAEVANVWVNNASPSPVYNVLVEVWCRDEGVEGGFRCLGDTSGGRGFRELVPPGGRSFAVAIEASGGRGLRAAVSFRDVNERHWRRDLAGRLVAVAQD